MEKNESAGIKTYALSTEIIGWSLNLSKSIFVLPVLYVHQKLFPRVWQLSRSLQQQQNRGSNT